jgi:hypothetical protein
MKTASLLLLCLVAALALGMYVEKRFGDQP